ncbi:MAG: lipoyl synthase [Verrucomicrobiota bacterium]|nr:lipoyl synthase [Verrucomicrobiota bacterium]
MPDAIRIQQRKRIPKWLRMKLPSSSAFTRTRSLLEELNLHTVCESAKCPNHWECWSKGTATFMIGGDRCTRACGFCAVNTAKPLPLEGDEPERVAEAIFRMKLRHVVITAVARDDLTDGGAGHFQATIKAVRRRNPGIAIEVLVPDFLEKEEALQRVLDAKPEIFNHNLETVRRLTLSVRSRALYDRSLSVLRKAREGGGGTVYTKSGLMLGLGETEEELLGAMEDLRLAKCDILTLGQYLQPSSCHLPVAEYVLPVKFEEYGAKAREMGFRYVVSGPMVRSSYHADEFQLPPKD